MAKTNSCTMPAQCQPNCPFIMPKPDTEPTPAKHGLNDITGVPNDSLECLRDILDTLTEREREVLEQRFGLRGKCARTLGEVARQFELTRERIRQIEAKALRKMLHPRRIRKLEEFVNLPTANSSCKKGQGRDKAASAGPSTGPDAGNEKTNAAGPAGKAGDEVIAFAELIRRNLAEVEKEGDA